MVDRLKLSGIVLSRGGATMGFADGGMFLDHVIEVRLDSRGAISQIGLAG